MLKETQELLMVFIGDSVRQNYAQILILLQNIMCFETQVSPLMELLALKESVLYQSGQEGTKKKSFIWKMLGETHSNTRVLPLF